MWEDHPVWKVDPVMAPFRTAAESGRFAGYAGPAGRAAAEAISKFIIVDMYAKAVQGIARGRRQMGPRRAGEDLRLMRGRIVKIASMVWRGWMGCPVDSRRFLR